MGMASGTQGRKDKCSILVGKPEGKRPLERPKLGCEGKVKRGIKKEGGGSRLE
jgi:hypothetical protein